MTPKLERTTPVDPRNNRIDGWSLEYGGQMYQGFRIGKHRALFKPPTRNDAFIRVNYEPKRYKEGDV